MPAVGTAKRYIKSRHVSLIVPLYLRPNALRSMPGLKLCASARYIVYARQMLFKDFVHALRPFEGQYLWIDMFVLDQHRPACHVTRNLEWLAKLQVLHYFSIHLEWRAEPPLNII